MSTRRLSKQQSKKSASHRVDFTPGGKPTTHESDVAAAVSAAAASSGTAGGEIEKSTSGVISELSSEEEYLSDSRQSSDEDLELLQDFDEKEAIKQLFNIIPSVKIVLSPTVQREMGLEIGPNVSSNAPWKQVKKDVLEDFLPEETPDIEELRGRISHFERGELILVGYAQTLSEDEDTFLVFDDEDNAKQAADIIKRLEAFYRRKVKMAFIKYPRFTWKTKGSEKEVDILMDKKNQTSLDVEIQSSFMTSLSVSRFKQRLSDDARDGYVELLPGKTKFENIQRKRIDLILQSAPPRIHIEQQTDPTFPTNAWSQYLYEIIPEVEEKCTQAEDDDDAEVHARQRRDKNKSNSPPPPVVMSDQVNELLDLLEFNIIDMYRNDYPQIANKDIRRSGIPILTESFCFADLSKSSKRFLNGLDWHPTLSGIAVTSYTFNTLSTSLTGGTAIDVVQRTVLEPNPVLMWSFDDILNPKLELVSPREVMVLSFCPYDENLLIGGFLNGQIVIWDLKNRIEKVETEEVLNSNQARYRASMQAFLAWTKEVNRDSIVLPSATSSLENSQKAAITAIQWINRKNYISGGGQIKDKMSGNFRFFATSSMDGTIYFWDLDNGANTEGGGTALQKQQQKTRRRKLPEGFLQEESEYKYLDKIFRPTFILGYKYPISGFTMNSVIYDYEPIDAPLKRKLFMRVRHAIKEVPQEPYQNILTIASYMGTVAKITWDGFDFVQGTETGREEIKQIEEYSCVHDGPIFGIAKSPYYEDLLLTVGRNILAVWQVDFKTTPILWRKRSAVLTDCMWSKNRPAVFFVTRDDGIFECWDLLAKTNEPCIMDALGGNTLTKLSQHKLSIPNEAIAIGDYNSNFRIILLPKDLVAELPNEFNLLHKFITDEINRKSEFLKWKEKWYIDNKELIEARKQGEEEARAEAIRMEKELREQAETQERMRAEEARKRATREAAKKVVFDLPERLEKKWDEMNFKRLMRLLMARRRVDKDLLAKQTKPFKDLMIYNARKKEAVKESFARISEEIANVRSKLLPNEVAEPEREDVARELISEIISHEENDFEELQTQLLTEIDGKRIMTTLDYTIILERATQRREVINQSLGSNVQRRITYGKCLEELGIKRTDNVNEEGEDVVSNKSVPQESQN